MGASNLNGLDELFSFLRRNGTEEIMETCMYVVGVYKYDALNDVIGSINLGKNGMACRRLRWDPNYKRTGDWQLAARKKSEKEW